MPSKQAKAIAAMHFFCNITDFENAVSVYEAVENSETLDQVLEKFKYVPWEPFSNMDFEELFFAMEDLANLVDRTYARYK